MAPLRALASGAALLLFLAVGTPAHGAELDWPRVADVRVIEIVTQDPDGTERRTKVWFVLVDGQAIVRTNGSRWLANIRRDPDVVIRIADAVYEHRAVEITDWEMIEPANAAFREKYGLQDWVVGLFRFGRPDLLRLGPRSAPGEAL